MKIFKEVVTYNGHRCDIYCDDVNHFDDIPDNLKLKAHAVCFHNGKIIVVNHPDWNIWGIPGGTRGPGESIEETLKREIFEETNCEILDYKPIAYHKVINPDGSDAYYGLQYLCNVRPLGQFENDIGGNIDKISWIDPGDFEQYIEDKEFKRSVIRRAIEILNKLI